MSDMLMKHFAHGGRRHSQLPADGPQPHPSFFNRITSFRRPTICVAWGAFHVKQEKNPFVDLDKRF